MHELALAMELVDQLKEACGEARVIGIVVEVGALAAVVPEALRFAFEVAGEGEPCEGARLELIETLARGRCRGCQSEAELASFYQPCECGALDWSWLRGEEVVIKSVEVA